MHFVSIEPLTVHFEITEDIVGLFVDIVSLKGIIK